MKNGCKFLKELAEQNTRIIQSLNSFLGDSITKEEFREDVEDIKDSLYELYEKIKSLKESVSERRI